MDNPRPPRGRRKKKKATTKAKPTEAERKKELAKKAEERKRSGRRVALEGVRALQGAVGGGAKASSGAAADEEGGVFEGDVSELAPIDLGKLEGIAVTVPVERTATDEEVDHRVSQLLSAHSPSRGLKDGEQLALGDEALLDLTGYIDGDAFLARVDEWMVLEANPLLPQLFEQLATATVGEHTMVRIALPEEYPDPRHAGKAAAFVIQVKAAGRVEPLSIDDASALKLLDRGANQAAVKKAVREELMEELADGLVAQAQALVISEAERRVTIELSQEVVDAEVLRLWRALEGDALAHGGATKEEQSAARQAWFNNADRRTEVRRALWADRLLDVIAYQRKIVATDDEVVKIVVQSAAAANLPVSDVHTALVKDPLAQAAMAQKLRRQHAMEWLLSEAAVTFGA